MAATPTTPEASRFPVLTEDQTIVSFRLSRKLAERLEGRGRSQRIRRLLMSGLALVADEVDQTDWLVIDALRKVWARLNEQINLEAPESYSRWRLRSALSDAASWGLARGALKFAEAAAVSDLADDRLSRQLTILMAVSESLSAAEDVPAQGDDEGQENARQVDGLAGGSNTEERIA